MFILQSLMIKFMCGRVGRVVFHHYESGLLATRDKDGDTGQAKGGTKLIKATGGLLYLRRIPFLIFRVCLYEPAQ